jgi:glyoxylase-like metal-dependent hydrolase (beta-lactamase superfamily II)
MHIKNITVGPIETNCYVVSDEASRLCAVIDPGDEPSRILDYIEGEDLKCSCVLLTHAHFDHVGAVPEILEETGATLYMNKKDNGVALGGDPNESFDAPEGTRFYSDGDVVEVGGISFKVLETPGHTPGSVCLICGDAIFTGDTLFRDSCGRTDFLLGDSDAMMNSLRRIARLNGDYEVFPGHMSPSTLERERRMNYFIHAALDVSGTL